MVTFDTTYDLLIDNSNAALELQEKNGSFPPGQNGIYNQSMSPVRPTSMWLITILKAYEITGRKKFARAANAAADYLQRDSVRPHGYTFLSRTEDNETKCDGLIGQATPIRALVRSGEILNRPELIESAVDVFSAHPFDKSIGLWEAVEVDGELLSFDRTLNHQVIFAAAGAELSSHSTYADQTVSRFLERFDSNIEIYKNGLIRHYIQPSLSTVLNLVFSNKNHWPLVWNELITHYYKISNKQKVKELGYYPTIILRLAHLNNYYPTHSIWETKSIQKVIQFLQSYFEILENEINYGATIPEFNLAFAWDVFFDPSEKELGRLIKKAINKYFDPESQLFTKNAEDPMLQSISIVHLVDLPEVNIK